MQRAPAHAAAVSRCQSPAFCVASIKRGRHTLRIPRNYRVCQQRQRVGYCDHPVTAPSALRRDLASVDTQLQLMNRFAAVEQRMHFAPKLHAAEVFSQE